MSELSDEAKALFSRARDELTPSEENRRRVKRAVLLGVTTATSLGVSGTASAAAGTHAAGAVASSASGAGFKVLLTFVFAAGIGAGGVVAYRLTETPAAQVVPSAPPGHIANRAPSAAVEARPSVAASASSTETPDAVPATAKSAAKNAEVKSIAESPRPEPPPAARGASVAEEARLLREADRALREGDADGALAVLEQHERVHPRGALAEERAAQRVFALCGGRRVAEARSAAVRFLEQYPKSPLAERVRATCAQGQASGEQR